MPSRSKKNGMIAQSERLYVEFKMAEAERELANAELQAQTIASALNSTLGQDNAWQPVTSMFIVDRVEEVAYYQDLAQDRNPLLNQVSLKRQLAEEGVRAQRADFLPQVAAIGGGSFYNYQVAGLVPRWAVGVGVNIKIFDGLNREYKYSAAKQTVRRVGALQNKAGKDISVLVEKLYNQMMNYRNQMTSIDASLAFAEEYLLHEERCLPRRHELVDRPDRCRTEPRGRAHRTPPRRLTISTCCWRNCSKPRASATGFRRMPAAPTPGRSCSIKSKKYRIL